jgi:hypothetical protein
VQALVALSRGEARRFRHTSAIRDYVAYNIHFDEAGTQMTIVRSTQARPRWSAT